MQNHLRGPSSCSNRDRASHPNLAVNMNNKGYVFTVSNMPRSYAKNYTTTPFLQIKAPLIYPLFKTRKTSDFIPISRNFHRICRTWQSSLWEREKKKVAFRKLFTNANNFGSNRQNERSTSTFPNLRHEMLSITSRTERRITHVFCWEKTNCSSCKLVNERIFQFLWKGSWRKILCDLSHKDTMRFP